MAKVILHMTAVFRYSITHLWSPRFSQYTLPGYVLSVYLMFIRPKTEMGFRIESGRRFALSMYECTRHSAVPRAATPGD